MNCDKRLKHNWLLRNLVNRLDRLSFTYWGFTCQLGYRIWGEEFRQRRIMQAPARYLPQGLRDLGAHIGTATFKPGLFLDNLDRGLDRLTIGDHVYLGPRVHLDLAAPVTIEPEAVVGPEAMLLTHGDVGARFLAGFLERQEGPILLKHGCWVGARAVILPGITVGEAAVVGAGAVVTHDVPDFTMVAGVPAREIKKLAKD